MKYVIIFCILLIYDNKELECLKQIEVPSTDDISDVVKYTYVDIKRSRNEAYAICQQRGGSLISVTNENIVNTLESLRTPHWNGAPNDDYWISLTELVRGEYIFTDCTQVFSDSGWSYFRDTDYKADEKCYIGKKEDHRWDNKKCSDLKDFICHNKESGACEMENLLVTDFEYSEKDLINCESGCKLSNNCWGFLHFGEMNCSYLLTQNDANAFINPLYVKTKECYSAEIITDSNQLPTVDHDTSLTPILNCSNNDANTDVTVAASMSSSSLSESLCSQVTVTETEVYNYTINATVTETETQTINITDTIISTVIDVQTESIYLTAYATAVETVLQVSSVECSCPTATVSMVYSVTTETVISSAACPSVSPCTQSTYTNYITINDTKAIDESIAKLKKELTISPTNTSAHKRKFISVMDSRPSVAAIGSVGLIFLVIPFSFILVIDFTRLVRGIKDLVDNIRHKD